LRRAEGGAKNFGVFRVKNHYFMPKNLIFSNLFGGGGGAECVPPGSAPVVYINDNGKRNNTKYIAQRTVNFSRFHNPSTESTLKATF
jgi:hypothetical protein